MGFTRTHTYATLDVRPGTWQEIADKLHAAGYDHAFHDDNLIDMHGIALTSEGEPSEIGNVKQELENLRTLLSAKFMDTGPGIAILTLQMRQTTMRQIETLRTSWKKAWSSEDDAPPLFISFGEFPLHKVEYNDSGIFIMRVPSEAGAEMLQNIANAWESIWKRTSTPNVPIAFLPDDLALELLSDAALQARGLMRIPSEVNFAG